MPRYKTTRRPGVDKAASSSSSSSSACSSSSTFSSAATAAVTSHDSILLHLGHIAETEGNAAAEDLRDAVVAQHAAEAALAATPQTVTVLATALVAAARAATARAAARLHKVWERIYTEMVGACGGDDDDDNDDDGVGMLAETAGDVVDAFINGGGFADDLQHTRRQVMFVGACVVVALMPRDLRPPFTCEPLHGSIASSHDASFYFYALRRAARALAEAVWYDDETDDFNVMCNAPDLPLDTLNSSEEEWSAYGHPIIRCCADSAWLPSSDWDETAVPVIMNSNIEYSARRIYALYHTTKVASFYVTDDPLPWVFALTCQLDGVMELLE
jgi:hypothetical protein